MGKRYSTLKVIQRFNGKWAVLWETKGEQPKIHSEHRTEQQAREVKKKLQPPKRKKARRKYAPL